MKKFILFMFMLITTLFNSLLITNAKEIKYENVITDTSSIEDDFEIIGLNINEYGKSLKYNYDKWYVIGMSEAYSNDNYNIQTYFYLFNPVEYNESRRSSMSDFTISYKFTENDNLKKFNCKKLDYNTSHLIYKVKGFTYDYISYKQIYIENVSYISYSSGSTYNYSSTFKSYNNHSKLNGFSIELSFDTMLVLEEYNVVPVKIEYDIENTNIFKEYWDYLFNDEEPKGVYVYFYNFNFPDHIKYDDVIYAKFEYDIVNYSKVVYGAGCLAHDYLEEKITEISRNKNEIQEYNQESNLINLKGSNVELDFPTFYLGNRITDNQFGNLIMDSYTDLFEYDCSVLLGSTYELCDVTYRCEEDINLLPVCGALYTYDQMEEIEILELHYTNDDVVYKCQVAGDNLSPGDPGYEEPVEGELPEEPDLFEKIKSWLKGWVNDNIKAFYEKFKTPILILGIGLGLVILYWILKAIVSVANLFKDFTNLKK